jgi:hypothetical protein
MKYIIQVEIDPLTGIDVEAQPDQIQSLVGKWQALNPTGMYFSLTRRAFTIILDAANEDAFFEALHATWVLMKEYPEVWPVADVQDFPALLRRAGVGR